MKIYGDVLLLNGEMFGVTGMRKLIAIKLMVLWLMALGTAIAQDKIAIQVINTADAARKVLVVDVICGNNVVFQDRLEPSQIVTVRICIDASGHGSIITTLVGGCASAVVTHIDNLVAGVDVNL